MLTTLAYRPTQHKGIQSLQIRSTPSVLICAPLSGGGAREALPGVETKHRTGSGSHSMKQHKRVILCTCFSSISGLAESGKRYQCDTKRACAALPRRSLPPHGGAAPRGFGSGPFGAFA